jgi:hypothetical protein
MLKRDYVLLNLDTGESLSLQRSLVCDAKQVCAELPEDHMMCLSSLWHNQMLDDIANEPQTVADVLNAISTFLIASRGHRLVLLDYYVFDKILDTVYKELELNDGFYMHSVRHWMRKDVCEFIRRRWLNLKDPTLDPSQAEGFVHKDITNDIKALYKRKIEEKKLAHIYDFDDSDYDDILGFKFS